MEGLVDDDHRLQEYQPAEYLRTPLGHQGHNDATGGVANADYAGEAKVLADGSQILGPLLKRVPPWST